LWRHSSKCTENYTHLFQPKKNFLEKVKTFRDTHVEVFRRYKHGGIPIIPGVEVNFTNPDNPYTKSAFDSYTLVLIGKDPLKDAMLVPYSDKVLEAYPILISSLP
jgi:hypothetical protein